LVDEHRALPQGPQAQPSEPAADQLAAVRLRLREHRTPPNVSDAEQIKKLGATLGSAVIPKRFGR
jgi:hypothetical protein